MLFNANALLLQRTGKPFREPKPDATPKSGADPKKVEYADEDMRNLLHGDLALMALDGTIRSDEEQATADKAKWVRSVMRREAVAEKIRVAMLGDGWAELSDEQSDLLKERIAQFAPQLTNAMVGPVIRALVEPPASRPEPKPNGAADHMAAP